ncbi:ARM repeat-containing protein [Gautieria morchelliformis]|nr:ARM repeat-containing protein [Gautieria morchelliformis]
MDTELGRCLTGTLNPDPNVRIKAELRLGELLPHPDAGSALAAIFVSKDVDIAMRQSASIVLRKYVKEHWSPYFAFFKGSAAPPEVKESIRTAVFHALSDTSSKVRSAAANVLSLIANSDWPDHCPDLLNQLLALLSSPSPDAVHGAMRVFTEFVKDDLTEDHMFSVLRQLLPVLMTIIGSPQQHSPLTRARAISVFRQCLSALYMVKEQHPKGVKEAVDAILPQWIDAFIVLLDHDLAEEMVNENNWDALLVCMQVFKTLDTIQTIFSRSLKSYSSRLLDAALRHLQILLPPFERYYLDPSASPPLSAEDEDVSLSRIACPIIDFTSNAARGSAARSWFEPVHLEQLTCTIFRWIQMTGEDEESWANNANAFVAHEEDESQEYSLRVAGLDLLACLLDRYSASATRALQGATRRLVDESSQERTRGSSEWWRPLEAALAALGAHSMSVLDTIEDEEACNRPKPFDVESLLTNVIPSLLTLTEYPFLQGRSFVFASQYTKRLPAGLASKYVNAAVEVLEASEAGVPVKVSAVKAIRNFCAQVDDSAIVPIAPRIIKDLGPFLLVTSEDTLALVLEAINVVVEIDDGKWLDPELAQLLSQAVLEVWTKNIKDPILLSILDDLLTDLTRSPAAGVYQAVVSHSLPTLCNALAQAKSGESWIASSAIDLICSLARGASRGGLGEGFFATLAPTLFECLGSTYDQETLENGIVLFTLIVRKDPAQLLAWSDGIGQTGLSNVLNLIARLLSPSESESGGLVIGDLIIHILRNTGDAVLPVLPDLMKAMANRMASAKTIGLLQSLIIPFAFMIHTHRDNVLDILESFNVAGVEPPKTGLEMLIATWTENTESFRGLWSQRISNLGLCSLLLSGRPGLQTIQVKGDMIIKPQTSNVIITRSRAKQTPHEFESVTFPVKALKLLLHDLHASGDAAAITARNGHVDSDDGDSEWADSDDGDEKLVQGLKQDEFAYLSEILGSKAGQFDEDEDGLDGGLDDEDLKQDPVSTMDMKAHLISFLQECARQNVNGFHAIVDRLNAEEMMVVRRVVEGN